MRWLKWIGGGLLVLLLLGAIGAVVGLHYAGKMLKEQVVAALGPNGEVGEVKLSWHNVEINKIRVKGPRGWPGEDALRAERIIVEPDLRSLLSDEIRVKQITLEGGYLSILRTRSGKVQLLPGIIARPAVAQEKASEPGPKVVIGGVTLKQGEVEFYDASVRKVPHKIRLAQLDARLGRIALPDMAGQTRLDLDGKVKGVRHDGKLGLHGWLVLQNKDADLEFRLQEVDLLVFQPYLIKASEVGVKRGDMNLDIHATVKNDRLKAPGTLNLRDLELGSGGGFGSTFMGMPRQLVVNSLKGKSGQITIKFTLAGNINDPSFSLNEDIAMRIGTAMAEGLGVNLGGLIKEVGMEPLKQLFGQ